MEVKKGLYIKLVHLIKMKHKSGIFLMLFLFLLAACNKTSKVTSEVNFSNEDYKIEELFNETSDILNESVLEEENLIPCQFNQTYLKKDVCSCNGSWIKYTHFPHSCTPAERTTFSCRKIHKNVIIGEVYVYFKPETTLEDANETVRKYSGQIMQYTCWFDRRENPYLIAAVREGEESNFIDSIKKEISVTSAHENRIATVGKEIIITN